MMIDASVANNGLVMIIISVLQHVALATCVFIALQMVISKAKLQHGLLCNLIKYNIYVQTLPRSVQAATSIYAEGRGFLRAYRSLAALSIRKGMHTFLLKPKFHVPWAMLGYLCYLDFSKVPTFLD